MDHGRRRSAQKRGQAVPHVDIDKLDRAEDGQSVDSLGAALDADVDFEAIDFADCASSSPSMTVRAAW